MRNSHKPELYSAIILKETNPGWVFVKGTSVILIYRLANKNRSSVMLTGLTLLDLLVLHRFEQQKEWGEDGGSDGGGLAGVGI